MTLSTSELQRSAISFHEKNGFLKTSQIFVNHLLFNAKSGSEALLSLYKVAKNQDRNVTLAAICSFAAIPSTGFLSDVLTDKRRLSAKYQAKVLRYFSLSPQQTQVAATLLELDRTRADAHRLKLQKRLTSQKKRLTEKNLHYRKDMPHLFQALDIFCAFGLFKNNPTKRDLLGIYKNARDLDRSLDILTELGLIKLEVDRYRINNSDQIIFNDASNSHIDYVRHALNDALKKIDDYYPQRRISHFESSSISVDKARFETFIKEFKDYWRTCVTDLETNDGDAVVRMTVCIYPITSIGLTTV